MGRGHPARGAAQQPRQGAVGRLASEARRQRDAGRSARRSAQSGRAPPRITACGSNRFSTGSDRLGQRRGGAVQPAGDFGMRQRRLDLFDRRRRHARRRPAGVAAPAGWRHPAAARRRKRIWPISPALPKAPRISCAVGHDAQPQAGAEIEEGVVLQPLRHAATAARRRPRHWRRSRSAPAAASRSAGTGPAPAASQPGSSVAASTRPVRPEGPRHDHADAQQPARRHPRRGQRRAVAHAAAISAATVSGSAGAAAPAPTTAAGRQGRSAPRGSASGRNSTPSAWPPAGDTAYCATGWPRPAALPPDLAQTALGLQLGDDVRHRLRGQPRGPGDRRPGPRRRRARTWRSTSAAVPGPAALGIRSWESGMLRLHGARISACRLIAQFDLTISFAASPAARVGGRQPTGRGRMRFHLERACFWPPRPGGGPVARRRGPMSRSNTGSISSSSASMRWTR